MQNRTSDMHALEESDHAIVPMNQLNNEVDPNRWTKFGPV